MIYIAACEVNADVFTESLPHLCCARDLLSKFEHLRLRETVVHRLFFIRAARLVIQHTSPSIPHYLDRTVPCVRLPYIRAISGGPGYAGDNLSSG